MVILEISKTFSDIYAYSHFLLCENQIDTQRWHFVIEEGFAQRIFTKGECGLFLCTSHTQCIFSENKVCPPGLECSNPGLFLPIDVGGHSLIAVGRILDGTFLLIPLPTCRCTLRLFLMDCNGRQSLPSYCIPNKLNISVA